MVQNMDAADSIMVIGSAKVIYSWLYGYTASEDQFMIMVTVWTW
jgi:hypothetical protein